MKRVKAFYAIKTDDDPDGYLMIKRNEVMVAAIFNTEDEAKSCLNRLYIDDEYDWEWIGDEPIPDYMVKEILVIEDHVKVYRSEDE